MGYILQLTTVLAILSIANAFFLVPYNNGNPVRSKQNCSSNVNPMDGGGFNTYTDIHIKLFTRHNPKQGKRIQLNSVSQLRASPFNPLHPTRVIIHGWGGSGNAFEIVLMRDAYLSVGDFNVFVVDWSLGAASEYEISRNRVGPVGQHVGMFLDFLKETLGYSFTYESVTVVGFSMGAHAAGYVGKSVRLGRISKLVALDPASTSFLLEDPRTRVDRSDADYVESVHSNIDAMGFEQPIGHAAFYPSFGRQQPGCPADPWTGCDHVRAVEFFAESIKNPRAFYGTRCASINSILSRSCPSTGPGKFMGGESLVPQQGADSVYYFSVNARSPFGQGQPGYN